MKDFIYLYGIAVSSALLGKTSDDEIAECLGDNDEVKIKIVKELQPVLMDFEISDKEVSKKIKEILADNNYVIKR